MGPLILAYDAECPFCRDLLRWAQARDDRGSLAPFPLQNPDLVRIAPELAGRDLREALHVVDGATREVWVGGDAWIALLGRLRGWRWVAPILGLPGIRGIVARAYRAVARRRYCRARVR